MKLIRQAKLEYGLNQLDIAPIINILFLILIFFILFSSFVSQTGIKINLPRTVTSDIVKDGSIVITIPKDNAIFLNNKAVGLKDLEKQLRALDKKNISLLIKVDRRVSLGWITDVCDLCRRAGLEKINIATN